MLWLCWWWLAIARGSPCPPSCSLLLAGHTVEVRSGGSARSPWWRLGAVVVLLLSVTRARSAAGATDRSSMPPAAATLFPSARARALLYKPVVVNIVVRAGCCALPDCSWRPAGRSSSRRQSSGPEPPPSSPKSRAGLLRGLRGRVLVAHGRVRFSYPPTRNPLSFNILTVSWSDWSGKLQVKRHA